MQQSDDTHHHFGFKALYQAWQACRRGKRGTHKAQQYEMGLLDKLMNTVDALQTKSWHPSRASRFVTLHPKPREILAAAFGDRVVHHLIVPWFEHHFEPVFIHDSFANRQGRGSHAAVDRLQHFTRCYAHVGGTRGWYLQLDIANFFHSINRRTLFGLLQARVVRDQHRPANDPRHADPAQAQDMLYVARQLLTGNPAVNAHYVGRPADLQRVPTHKQLIHAAPEHGLPIGNLSSQFFANVYLNELDQFIKHTLKVPHYVRYVDDFVLLHHSPSVLAHWRAQIVAFLHRCLGLRLRDDGRLAPISNGIDFLGYIVRPHYRLVRRRVITHLKARLAIHARRVLRQRGRLLLCSPMDVNAIQSTLASYLGHFRHARAHSLYADILVQHPWLVHLIHIHPDGRLQRLDAPPLVGTLVTQWSYFRARYPQHVLLMQVGHAWECTWPQGMPLALTWGAKLVKRPGLPPTWQVPAASVHRLKRCLCHQAHPWCDVREVGQKVPHQLKRRQLYAVFPVLPTQSPSPSFSKELDL